MFFLNKHLGLTSNRNIEKGLTRFCCAQNDDCYGHDFPNFYIE